MDLSQITPQQRELINTLSCEIEIEKHECYTWNLILDVEGRHRPPDAGFLEVEGKAILIPVPLKQIPNIRLLQVFQDRHALIVVLQDPTFEEETHGGGYFVFSRRMPGADWYIATMYRAVYSVDPADYGKLGEVFACQAKTSDKEPPAARGEG